ncbi:MAG: bifunctional DNA-formamidopyrimidine glycosylase/DNA-(apurinic or apyrimidinic site) lyase [Oligoflexales bacterium]
MPELPEVECLTQSIKSVLEGQQITNSWFFRKDLRWEIPISEFQQAFHSKKIGEVRRRSKYILMTAGDKMAAIHLGMSGNVLLFDTKEPSLPHTHFVLEVNSAKGKQYLHYVDPRRFGFLVCFKKSEFNDHALFKHLGPEPLEAKALGAYLWKTAQKKSAPIKSFLMDAKNVVGVGNIYANEALFRAGISPLRASSKISKESFTTLGTSIQKTLKEAIRSGGTSFKDYKHLSGESGYFAIKLNVYGKEGDPCPQCKSPIQSKRLSNRATYYCMKCQS